MTKTSKIAFYILLFFTAVSFSSCDYATHRTLSKDYQPKDEVPDPDYEISLDYNYQDFVSFMFMGNRSESFSTYFNKFYTANEDYKEALNEYKASTIASFNRRLDSLNIITPVQQSTIEKFNKVIERCSKVIQYNKNTKYVDDAVLLIGLSYFYSNDFIQAERKFHEFLSKLTKSDLADEALLYLGITKLRLRRYADAETILKSLLQTTKKVEIKADVLQRLAIYNLGLKNITDAQNYLIQSIEMTTDKEIKAERQYLLAKMYSIYSKKDAPKMYAEAYKNTSNFDFEFYAKFNEAKAYNEINDYKKALEILNKMNKKYIDYPDFKQFVELEIANTDFYENRYTDAKNKYFTIIAKNPGTKAAAESYYELGVYYELTIKDYLKALISYKKAYETSPLIDYADLCKKKTEVLDRYFAIQGIIHDTTKIEIPAEEYDLMKFKEAYDKEFKDKFKINEDPVKNGEKGKGGGYSSRDTIPENDSLLKAFVKIIEEKNKEKTGLDSNKLILSLDTIGFIKDSLKIKTEIKDTVKTPVVNLDSLREIKESIKLNAYFELSEIFYYNLNRQDSAIHYLNKIITDYSSSGIVSKALFYLGTIYKSAGDSIKANEYFNNVINRFPNSVYANESRKYLGQQTVLQSYDAADSLLTAAQRLLGTNNKDKVASVIYEAIDKYPNSPLLPKAYYSLGWVYEYIQPNKDSALKYYSIVLNRYPQTDFAASVKSKYDYYESLNKKDTIKNKDSLMVKDSTMNKGDTLKTNINGTQNDSLKNNIPNDSGNNNPNTPEDKEKKESPGELLKPKEQNSK
jgi:TolA-binding protein/predicted negative regulator of RcsB-dependent stress response